MKLNATKLASPSKKDPIFFMNVIYFAYEYIICVLHLHGFEGKKGLPVIFLMFNRVSFTKLFFDCIHIQYSTMGLLTFV